jgi:hypothetical protein
MQVQMLCVGVRDRGHLCTFWWWDWWDFSLQPKTIAGGIARCQPNVTFTCKTIS